MLNSIGPVIARRRDAETVTYCWEHSVHPSVHSHATVHANNNRMSGTHHCDGSSRASHLYRHPQDASQYADSKAVGKQQAFANLHGVLAKNPATLNEATDRESHHHDDSYSNHASATSRATLAEDTYDTRVSSNRCSDMHRTTNTECCAMGSNTRCFAIPPQQIITDTCMMNQNPRTQYSGSMAGYEH